MTHDATDPGHGAAHGTGGDLTSLHVRRAIDGEAESRAWVVERFTPALLLQARYRLKGALSSFCDPEDLVQDVWSVALPRLPDLVARDGRWTPVVVKFLSTTLLYRTTAMAREYARGDRPRRETSIVATDDARGVIDRVVDSVTGVPARAAVREMRAKLLEHLDALGEQDREILVLRGIEQVSNGRVAELLGIQKSAVSMRYARAVDRLRAALPASVFADFATGDD